MWHVTSWSLNIHPKKRKSVQQPLLPAGWRDRVLWWSLPPTKEQGGGGLPVGSDHLGGNYKLHYVNHINMVGIIDDPSYWNVVSWSPLWELKIILILKHGFYVAPRAIVSRAIGKEVGFQWITANLFENRKSYLFLFGFPADRVLVCQPYCRKPVQARMKKIYSIITRGRCCVCRCTAFRSSFYQLTSVWFPTKLDKKS